MFFDSQESGYSVNGRNGEEDLRIPGRIYRNKCPECTPDVEYYSVKENPQRGHALSCGVRQSWTLPVLEHSSQICVGVLKLVRGFWLRSTLDCLDAAFQEVWYLLVATSQHGQCSSPSVLTCASSRIRPTTEFQSAF